VGDEVKDWRYWKKQSSPSKKMAKMHARRLLLLVPIILMLADSGCAYLRPDPDYALKREQEEVARQQYLKKNPGMELFYNLISAAGTLVK
jgi:hypothetical protein